MQVFFLVFFKKFRIPKQIIQRDPQNSANSHAKADRGVVISAFDGVDGLPGYPQLICKGLLGQPLTQPGLFHSIISAHGSLSLIAHIANQLNGCQGQEHNRPN